MRFCLGLVVPAPRVLEGETVRYYRPAEIRLLRQTGWNLRRFGAGDRRAMIRISHIGYPDGAPYYGFEFKKKAGAWTLLSIAMGWVGEVNEELDRRWW